MFGFSPENTKLLIGLVSASSFILFIMVFVWFMRPKRLKKMASNKCPKKGCDGDIVPYHNICYDDMLWESRCKTCNTIYKKSDYTFVLDEKCMCQCSCGTQCPLGKVGTQKRCSGIDLSKQKWIVLRKDALYIDVKLLCKK